MPPALPDPERWQALCGQAVEPAPMSCPPVAQAAMAHLPAAQRPRLWTVPPQGAAPGEALLAVAALSASPLRWWPLGRIVGNRWGEFFFLGTPLIAAQAPQEAWRALLALLRADGAAALELRTLPADGAALRCLGQLLAGQGRQMVELARWRRAALDAERDPEQWWRQDVSRRHRKEWSRLKRRLAERGALAFEALEPQAPDGEREAWLADFMRLEAAGWKGRAGTAVACSPHNAAFVRAMTAAFHAQRCLRFWRLRLDGRTIAALFALVQGSRLWLGKIAYDEAFAAFSPGVLLTVEATRAILAEPGITFADSCADPNHPMIDHIWKQRLKLVDVLVPLPGVPRWRFAALVAAERGYRGGRELAKRIWHRLRRRR